MVLGALPSKAVIIRILSYFKALLLAPLWKGILLLMNNVYSWFIAAGWVIFTHREPALEFISQPSWGHFVEFWRQIAQTLVEADKQVYDATLAVANMDASFTAPIVLASALSAIISALLTVLLFIKVFDYGLRAIGWLDGSPKLASFSLAVVIWFLIVAAFNSEPFIGFRTLIYNFEAVVESIYTVTPFVETPENLTAGNISVNTTVPEPP